jgi:hypothetical protein
MNLDDSIIPGSPFTWREALTQGTTGVVATPTPDQEAAIVKQATLLSEILTVIGPCGVNSWLRTPEHNKAVGGARYSAHLQGAATDLRPLTMPVDVAKRKLGALTNRKLFFEINTTNWLHLDFIHNHDFIA